MSEPDQSRGRYSALRTGSVLLAIPTLLIVSPLLGFYLGSRLDRWLKSAPWFSLVGLALGFAAAGRETYLIYRRYQERAEGESQERR